jgi:hypothetical protein
VTRARAGEGPSVVEALDKMLANVDLPYEAEADVALAYQTARRVDAWNTLDGYAPVANAMSKQLAVLRTWIQPPPLLDEDPFDALARSLRADVGTGAADAPD